MTDMDKYSGYDFSHTLNKIFPKSEIPYKLE